MVTARAPLVGKLSAVYTGQDADCTIAASLALHMVDAFLNDGAISGIELKTGVGLAAIAVTNDTRVRTALNRIQVLGVCTVAPGEEVWSSSAVNRERDVSIT